MSDNKLDSGGSTLTIESLRKARKILEDAAAQDVELTGFTCPVCLGVFEAPQNIAWSFLMKMHDGVAKTHCSDCRFK